MDDMIMSQWARFPSFIDLACGQLLSDCVKLAPGFHDHHLRHLLDQAGNPICGPHTEVILHLRPSPGVVYPRADTMKELTEAERKGRGNYTVLVLFVRSCRVDVGRRAFACSSPQHQRRWQEARLQVYRGVICRDICTG